MNFSRKDNHKAGIFTARPNNAAEGKQSPSLLLTLPPYMNGLTTTYLSLGSNLGNRSYRLQKALLEIDRRVGKVLQISPVYESPAWGFEGEDFLNCCISVETSLSARHLLDKVLQIETEMGRLRSADGNYQSRTLDIDILYFGKEVLSEDHLQIPHPHLQKRRFVLKPLADIAPQFYHPVLNKDSRNMLQECRDKTPLEKTTIRLFPDLKNLFANQDFIAIEGNIGAGKTTLATKIAEELNGKLILERFADNPFLPKFYQDQARYAFPLEMSFLADRYQQFIEDTRQLDLFSSFMISDYDIYKSLIFAKVTLGPEEFELYRKLFGFMYKEVRKPRLYIYLYQQTERLLEQIARRGRDYEQGIPPEYLEEIQKGYFAFMKNSPDLNSLIIDVSELDFVSQPADYETIIDQIVRFTAGE